jgi:anti-sigma regulatory factor (Ser/Thr protein kinase)
MPPSLKCELPRQPSAAAEARRLLEHAFTSGLDRDDLDTMKLLASELVNNAVLHGAGKIKFAVELDTAVIRVDVVDEGSGFVHHVREIGFDEVSGRGLQIVDAMSSRWGLFEGTTHVWFELDRAGGAGIPR